MHHFKKCFLSTVLLSFSLIGQSQITWQGTTSNWFTTTNWSCTCTPTGTDDIIIPAGASAYPNISSSTASARNITINSGASLTVSSSGILQIAGSISNNGSFTASAGSITFNGSTAQSIAGSIFTSSTIRNLVISNTAGVSISSALSIAANGSLTVNSGSTLTTGGNLTLLSSSAGTARVANSAGVISGNVTTQRYIPGGRRAFRWLSHPFTTSQPLSVLTDDIDITGTGGSTNGFTTTVSNNPSSMWYNVATADGDFAQDAGWTPFTSTNGAGANAWAKGQGINVLVRGAVGQGLTGLSYTPSAVTLDMTGVLNQGSQIINVTRGPNPTAIYYFVGNPYHSQVDLNLTVRSAGINNFYYIWNSQAGTRGSFEAKFYSNSYILPAGAAFVTGCSANGTITFNESSKSSSTPNSILRTTSVSNKLLLRLTSNNDSIAWDKLELYFDKDAAKGTDANDAPKFRNPEVNFYSFSGNGKKLDLNSCPFESGDIIPLGLTNILPGIYTIHAEDLVLPINGNICLYDRYLNKLEELLPGSQHTFTVGTDSLSFGDKRFELRMKVLPTLNQAPLTLQVTVYPNPTKGIINVDYQLPNAGQAQISIYNLAGIVCKQFSKNVQENGSMQFSMEGLSAGMYIMEITSGGKTIRQSFIKQ